MNHPQKDLKDFQKELINHFCLNCKNITDILSSLQIVLFFTSGKHYDVETTLNEIILTKLPNYISINADIKELLSNNHHFTLSNFREVYEFIELYSFPRLEMNINMDFKSEIEPEVKIKLENHFKNNPKCIVTKKELATVVRRYIIRFLTGNLQAEEIGFDKEIIDFLNAKEDLWNSKIYDNENRENEMYELMGLKLLVKHSLNLYHFIGGDLELPKREVTNKNNMEEDQDMIVNNQKKLKKKGKKGMFE